MGRPPAKVPNSPLTEVEKNAFKLKIDYKDNHWLWTGTIDRYGYGVLRFRGSQWKAHRLIYYVLGMNLDPSLVVDHRCEYRHCINPACTRELDNATNVLIGSSPHARNVRKTQCPNGHDYKIRINRSMAKGWQRYCPICNRRKRNQKMTEPDNSTKMIEQEGSTNV